MERPADLLEPLIRGGGLRLDLARLDLARLDLARLEPAFVQRGRGSRAWAASPGAPALSPRAGRQGRPARRRGSCGQMPG